MSQQETATKRGVRRQQSIQPACWAAPWALLGNSHSDVFLGFRHYCYEKQKESNLSEAGAFFSCTY